VQQGLRPCAGVILVMDHTWIATRMESGVNPSVSEANTRARQNIHPAPAFLQPANGES
jgi:hypothetical protein